MTSPEHICQRCRADRGAPTHLTREQLERLFAACPLPIRDTPALLAEMVTDFAQHCPACVDATLAELEQFVELVIGGATADEGLQVIHARHRRGARWD